jgi:hypothetical protein
VSKIHTTEPIRPISGYRYEREHRTANRCLLAIAAIVVFAGFMGWL